MLYVAFQLLKVVIFNKTYAFIEPGCDILDLLLKI